MTDYTRGNWGRVHETYSDLSGATYPPASTTVNFAPDHGGLTRRVTRGGPQNPGGATVQRAKTLTRPERFVAPAPLIDPTVNGIKSRVRDDASFDWWGLAVSILTFWAPYWLLNAVGFPASKQRAWKEKCALCTISFILMAIVGFLTIGLTKVLCPSSGSGSAGSFVRLGTEAGYVGINGWMMSVGNSTPSTLSTVANTLSGEDTTHYFSYSNNDFPACDGLSARYATANLCATESTSATASCTYGTVNASLIKSLDLKNTSKYVGYDWDQTINLPYVLVIDGDVLNLESYFTVHPSALKNDTVDATLRRFLNLNGVNETDTSGGKDATRIFYNEDSLKTAAKCLRQRYRAGHIDKITPGCFISNLFLYCSLVVIFSIIFARFFMALLYAWVLSGKLIGPPKNLKRKVISPAVMPEGALVDVNNTTGAAPWTEQAILKRKKTLRRTEPEKAALSEKAAEPELGQGGMISLATIGEELFCVCLVTCYSEGEEGLKGTLDSIAGSSYSDNRKLIMVVCDGIVTGHGEKLSTPDICVGLMESDTRFGTDPTPMSYISIAEGEKAHNQAIVYAGHYLANGHRTPMLVIAKCGTEQEASAPKPGNRGKRDSQMILMSFFSHVTYNDRMSPLEYDLFRKTHALMGVTPDFFEVCLMVDADTVVAEDSISMLVRCMQHDRMIMGVCGETRVENKTQSWVTAIQVFEYYISHHMAKSFESVFGGVTCLPGCFSMYRLKARKYTEDDWFPVLVQPQIVSVYATNTVSTLHEKNLLLLGEDRFLTTLLLRTFPNRKMIFCPQAKCRTVVPDTFKVLLSQRRRWINSTIHNLLELVRVRNLCGTFCFSMQFVVGIDLLGTIVLPIAICLTYYLIISSIINPPNQFSDAIPLMLLVAVLGLPGFLIMLISFKVSYLLWLGVYLIALPIWNLVLPLYAFSKFDDFSWGETRKVDGQKDEGHGSAVSTQDETLRAVQSVPLRRWEDWERSRVRKVRRDARRRRDLEQSNYGSMSHLGDPLNSAGMSVSSSYMFSPSDNMSLMSEDERVANQIGEYREDRPGGGPPPIGLYQVDDVSDYSPTHSQGRTLNMDDLGLDDEGWDESEEENTHDVLLTDNFYQQPSHAQPHAGGFSQLAPGSNVGSSFNLLDDNSREDVSAMSREDVSAMSPLRSPGATRPYSNNPFY